MLEKYWALRDIEICKTVKHKIIDFFADYKNNEEIFSNIPATDYTFTNDIKEHFFVLVYDEKIIDNKTNEIVFSRREVYPNNEYWLLLHDTQALITSRFHLRIGSKIYTNKFKSIFIFNSITYSSASFEIYKKISNLKYYKKQ